jgi:hypothetical protein
MESIFETIMTPEELELFKAKSLTEDEISNLKEDLVEYYENAGFENVRERAGFDEMNAEEIVERVVALMQEMIDQQKEYLII